MECAAALQRKLLVGLRQMTQVLDEKSILQLVKYIKLLSKWNKTYNLTSVRKPEEMVTRHLLDSLAICPYLRGNRILDVGTGAGLPGIPLAIAFPGRHFSLLDSNNKKTRFVRQAATELELPNIDVVQSRVENFKPFEPYDTIITRAYSTLGDMIKQTSHLLALNGIFLAMKGVNPVVEVDNLPTNYRVEENYKIKVPGLNEERHCLEIKIG